MIYESGKKRNSIIVAAIIVEYRSYSTNIQKKPLNTLGISDGGSHSLF